MVTFNEYKEAVVGPVVKCACCGKEHFRTSPERYKVGDSHYCTAGACSPFHDPVLDSGTLTVEEMDNFDATSVDVMDITKRMFS